MSYRHMWGEISLGNKQLWGEGGAWWVQCWSPGQPAKRGTGYVCEADQIPVILLHALGL
jgi:hypothetical protein